MPRHLIPRPRAGGRPLAAQQPAFDWHPIETTLGRAGIPQPGGVMRFNFPFRSRRPHWRREDRPRPRARRVGGLHARGPDGIAMGDLVLTLDEIAGVTRALQQGGVEITAEHNKLMGEEPRVMHLAHHGERLRGIHRNGSSPRARTERYATNPRAFRAGAAEVPARHRGHRARPWRTWHREQQHLIEHPAEDAGDGRLDRAFLRQSASPLQSMCSPSIQQWPSPPAISCWRRIK